MGIREIMRRAQKAQQEHDKRIPVQLEIPQWPVEVPMWHGDLKDRFGSLQEPETLWASEEEQLERFREETVK